MKSKKGILIIIAVLVVLCLVLAGTIIDWTNIQSQNSVGRYEANREYFISEEFYFTLNDPEHRVTQGWFSYYDNILEITAEFNIPKREFENLAREYNAEITSYRRDERFGDAYTFTFSNRFTFGELEELATKFSEKSCK